MQPYLSRQGDVILQAIPEADVEKLKEEAAAIAKTPDCIAGILEHGEVTGHKHQLHGETGGAYHLPRTLGAPLKCAFGVGGANLAHEEHPTLTKSLKTFGNMAWGQKRQYNADAEGGWDTVRD